MAVKILIDCDPGVDDALAILLAAGNPAVEIVAITTVAGNQTLDKVTDNALRIAAAAGLAVPVAAGCDRPLVREQILAPEIHGDSGLGGVAWPEPVASPVDVHAVDLIIDTVLAAPGEVTLVPIGPLTNIAMAIRKRPEIVSAVRDVVLMGGSYTRGNTTPAAEFNILVDPEAAAAVFNAGWTVTMVGLDLTRQAPVTADLVDHIRAIDGKLGRLVLDTMTFYNSAIAELGRSADGTRPAGSLHDPCAVAQVIDPTLLELVPAYVEVETSSRLTYGMTVTDFDLRGPEPNTRVATRLDAPRFYDLLVGAITALS